MIETLLTKFRDAQTKESLLHNLLPAASILFFCGGSVCTTNTGWIKSERVAVTNAACLFAKDHVRTETIAEGSSGK
jgi:hypothetical protein